MAALSTHCQVSQGRIRDSGVYKIKKWGEQNISHGGEGGGESFTHPQGRSESLTSDLSLKEGNLGEGEKNMSEQSRRVEGERREQRLDAWSISTSKEDCFQCVFTPPPIRLSNNWDTFVVLALTCAIEQQSAYTYLIDADILSLEPLCLFHLCTSSVFFFFLL